MNWTDGIDLMCDDLAARGRAPKTLRYYRTQLTQLAGWALEEGITLTSFDKTHWNRYCKGRMHLRETTRYADGITSKVFFTWLRTEGYIKRNPLADLSTRRPARPFVRMPSQVELDTLEKALQDKWNLKKNPAMRDFPASSRRWHCARDLALVQTLRYTGMRVNEVLALTLDDWQSTPYPTLAVRAAKDREPRIVPVCDTLQRSLEQWYTERKAAMSRLHTGHREKVGPWLFLSVHGGPVGDRRFQYLFDKYRDRAGLPHFTVHSLKHHFVTQLLCQGDVVAASVITGTAISTLQRHYAHLLPEHVRHAVMKLEKEPPGSEVAASLIGGRAGGSRIRCRHAPPAS